MMSDRMFFLTVITIALTIVTIFGAVVYHFLGIEGVQVFLIAFFVGIIASLPGFAR